MLSVHSSRPRRQKRPHNKKERKLIKLIKNDSETDGDESEHELSFYMKDRVKLMKEVLKIIKPKKIRGMAPDCMRGLDNEEINSRLLEELLGISDKRLKYIFTGQNLNEDSSSTDPEAEDEPIDLISLDEISDGDLVIDLDSDREKNRRQCKKHKTKIKEEHKKKKVKKEKPEEKTERNKNSKDSASNKTSEENLMSVLELLELQARARAIKSQLVLEKQQEREKQKKEIVAHDDSDDDNDAVIVEDLRNDEIVISSSDSEIEQEPVDFWHGTREKNIDEGDGEKDNEPDLVQEQQPDDAVTVAAQKETVEKVLEADVTTRDDNADPQNCTNLSKESEPVDITNIPLPESERLVVTEGKRKSSNKDENEMTQMNGEKGIPNDTDNISEGEIESTEGETRKKADMEGGNNEIDDTAVIEVQNIIENESNPVPENLLTVELKVSQKDDGTPLQIEETVNEKKSESEQQFDIEESAKDFEKDIGTSSKDQEKLEEYVSAIQTNNENKGEHQNGSMEIPKSSPRKSKRLSTLSATKKSPGKRKANILKKSKGKNMKRAETEKGNSSDDGEGIVLNLEQSELDSVDLD